MKLARRLATLEPSATLAVSNRVSELIRAGHPVVSLAAGEPDFPTPPHVVEAMVAAARGGATRYPPQLGLPQLRELVATSMSSRYAVPIRADEVLVTPGAKFGLWAAFQAIVDDGDEVLVPTPCWVSYEPQIRLAGGHMIPVPSRAEDGWQLDPDAIERALTCRTVAIALNLPNNPTGQLAPLATLAAIADLAVSRGLWLICDDIYAELCFLRTGQFPSPLAGRPDLLGQTIVVDGPSKSHAMTGWRLGYLRAPTPVFAPIARLLGQTATGVNTFAQHGAIAALSGPSTFVDQARTAYASRAALLMEGLLGLGLKAVPPEGAFYALVDIRPLLAPHGPFTDDAAFARALLDDALVATVPGSGFAAPGFLRLSFATSEANIRGALSRFGIFTARYR
jgi:aspartate aminotransferase